MGATTGVEVLGQDAVVVKRASGGSAAIESLRREGERLRRAAHPGVVAVVRSAPSGDGWELVLSHGGRSLATLERPSVAEAAAIVAGLASTLADLHAIGVTHGRIDPGHVLLGDHGGPRLCGFGDGAVAAAREDDVAALGSLLEHLLGGGAEPEPIPERRWARRRREHGWERQTLLLLVDQAVSEDPSRRPTARQLAAAIAATVPGNDQVPQPGPEADDPIERLRPTQDEPSISPPWRTRPIVLAVAGIALAIVAAQVMRAPEGSTTPPAAVEAPPSDERVAQPVAGSVVHEDGRRYRVGQAGDHLLVDDWACDGRPTPAAFRPSTHEVFVFERWAASEPVSVPATARLTDAVAMVSTSGADGCPELLLRTADGSVVPVSLGGIE